MADISLYSDLVFKLRGYPAIHRPLKRLRRALRQLSLKGIELVRALAPARSPRLGPPVGSYSIYTSVLQDQNRPQRIVLTDQGVPPTTPDSLQVVSKLGQHASQPWPIFWSRHKNARLVSTSLALLDDQKRICRESTYGDHWFRDDPAWNYLWLPKPVSLPGNWTSLVSWWTQNNGAPPFSHWLLAALPRLALLPEFPPDPRMSGPGRLAG